MLHIIQTHAVVQEVYLNRLNWSKKMPNLRQVFNTLIQTYFGGYLALPSSHKHTKIQDKISLGKCSLLCS